jgi:hypothetical protein
VPDLCLVIRQHVLVKPAGVLYAAASALGWYREIGLVAFGLVLLVAALMWIVGWVRPGGKGGIPRRRGFGSGS